jgi:hypothetical protein
MSHLWYLNNSQWVPARLAGAMLGLPAEGGGEPLPVRPTDDVPVRLRAAGKDWVLLAAPAARVRVNGELLGLGCRVLRDRDEIALGGMRAYYSTECLPVVEPFPGASDVVFCARCRKPIEPGTPAVRCPGCNTWCHEIAEELNCWTYMPACPLCEQPTALDSDYRWRPEL